MTTPSSVAHIPVFLEEVLHAFGEQRSDAQTYMDGTFGRGGHARRVLEKFPSVVLWAFDQDQVAIDHGKANFAQESAQGRAHFIHANYADFEEVSKTHPGFPKKFDLILLDLGVSSPQLDEAARGFSFYHDGPLDMRMNQSQELTAADVVNSFEEQELAKIFIELGEVQRPFRVVRAIVHDRKENPFTSTRQLASLIERVDGWQKKGMHPATRYFMALRLSVNDELGQLERALPVLISSLSERGRLSVITFHSLEDRIVKNVFKAHLEHGRLVNKKVIKPSDEEIKRNPRSRSAKLRTFEKGPG